MSSKENNDNLTEQIDKVSDMVAAKFHQNYDVNSLQRLLWNEIVTDFNQVKQDILSSKAASSGVQTVLMESFTEIEGYHDRMTMYTTLVLELKQWCIEVLSVD